MPLPVSLCLLSAEFKLAVSILVCTSASLQTLKSYLFFIRAPGMRQNHIWRKVIVLQIFCKLTPRLVSPSSKFVGKGRAEQLAKQGQSKSEVDVKDGVVYQKTNEAHGKRVRS